MKALFREIDLYKGIILGCLVLIPVAAFFAWSLRQEIQQGEEAIAQATKRNGTLERIGMLQKQLESLIANRRRTGQVQNHREYFDNQLFSTENSPLSKDDFEISAAVPQPGGQGRQRHMDYEVTINFKKKGGRSGDKLAMPRDFIYAMLFNCESQSGPGVWKLRQLSMVNAEADKASSGSKTPIAELKDDWYVNTLKFVRRGPDTRSR